MLWKKKSVNISPEELVERFKRGDETRNSEGSGLGLAIAIGGGFATTDYDVRLREEHYYEEKKRIGRFAAALIEKNDFVFIDAGTTTEAMVDAITERGAVYVTNGMNIAKKTSAKRMPNHYYRRRNQTHYRCGSRK